MVEIPTLVTVLPYIRFGYIVLKTTWIYRGHLVTLT